jgi:hypothetical protein
MARWMISFFGMFQSIFKTIIPETGQGPRLTAPFVPLKTMASWNSHAWPCLCPHLLRSPSELRPSALKTGHSLNRVRKGQGDGEALHV